MTAAQDGRPAVAFGGKFTAQFAPGVVGARVGMEQGPHDAGEYDIAPSDPILAVLGFY
jgi:hypothetical protein